MKTPTTSRAAGKHPPKPQPPAPTSEALKAGGDIIRLSTSLATGALVFSVGLAGATVSYGAFARLSLVAAWVMLMASVIAGVFSQAAIPVLLADGNYSLESKTFTWPGRAHQLLFLAGVAALALALVLTVLAAPLQPTPKIANAAAAVSAAVAGLQPPERVCQIRSVGLVPASEPARLALSTWRVQLELTRKATCVAATDSNADFFVEAGTGKVLRVAEAAFGG